MSTGRLIPPNLDDRSWQDIVDETRALIPKYAPDWTDHNPSDPGITLIELFAWIVEGMIYRLNRVPEKNYVEFLNLIGITRDPATPARTDLTFSLSGAGPVPIPAGTQVATPQTETEGSIIFETDENLTALPINLTHCLLIEDPTVHPLPYKNLSTHLVIGPLQDTLVQTLSHEYSEVFLGFDKPTTDPLHINFRFKESMPEDSAELDLMYFANDSFNPIPIIDDQTDSFNKDGRICVQLPGDWQSSKPGDWSPWYDVIPATPDDEVKDSRFWLVLGIGNQTGSDIDLILESAAFNSASATNALTVNKQQSNGQAEIIGISNGKPFQLFTLKNTPLFKNTRIKDPYAHLIIQVREPVVGGAFGPWEEWTRVEDIQKGDGKEYICNPVTGEIMFGDYDPKTMSGNGHIPLQESEIRALTYRYVAGDSKGNVSAHTLKVLRSPVSGGVSVTNPGDATGGSDQEKSEDTKRRGPQALKNRDRAVTTKDYEYLAKEATTDVQIVRALPPRLFTQYEANLIGYSYGESWSYADLNRDIGHVNVIIIPQASIDIRAPMPSDELLQEVSDYLEDRRIVTTSLHVTSPRYLPIEVIVDFTIWQSAVDLGLVVEQDFVANIESTLNKFLHPNQGGAEGEGWEVGQDITVSSLLEFIEPEPEIGLVSNLEIKAHNPLYSPNIRPYAIPSQGVWIRLADYEIVCSHTSHTINFNVVLA